ncbi:hypothetical protein AVEN_16177-1 [Araneus ventricosus]|uniref:Uncharacterized protein n=1 Tax=Araneus ventricosus TaxID=182803 RepID=A0A4Y2VWC5_ARAVE|nr:hypothetical protein AVEN_16177-1 [Araneus ventricosus]
MSCGRPRSTEAEERPWGAQGLPPASRRHLNEGKVPLQRTETGNHCANPMLFSLRLMEVIGRGFEWTHRAGDFRSMSCAVRTHALKTQMRFFMEVKVFDQSLGDIFLKVSLYIWP